MEDIIDFLDEMFPIRSLTLMSRVRTTRLSADHKCSVEVKIAVDKKSEFCWPEMNDVDKKIFLDLKKTGS